VVFEGIVVVFVAVAVVVTAVMKFRKMIDERVEKLEKWLFKVYALRLRPLTTSVGAITAIVVIVGGLVLINYAVTPVMAEEVSINWTDIGNLIEGAGSIMPSVGTLIVSVVPILLLLIIVGFVTGLFDGIIGAIQDAMRLFRR